VNTPATAAPGVEADQQQVAAVGLADAGLGDAEGESGNGQQFGGNGRLQIDRHGRRLRVS
jgi:hypothetical protein